MKILPFHGNSGYEKAPEYYAYTYITSLVFTYMQLNLKP